jgi:hypothetical protein
LADLPLRTNKGQGNMVRVACQGVGGPYGAAIADNGPGCATLLALYIVLQDRIAQPHALLLRYLRNVRKAFELVFFWPTHRRVTSEALIAFKRVKR